MCIYTYTHEGGRVSQKNPKSGDLCGLTATPNHASPRETHARCAGVRGGDEGGERAAWRYGGVAGAVPEVAGAVPEDASAGAAVYQRARGAAR